jgi:hypothetical protein
MSNSTIFSAVGKRHPCPMCRGVSGCLIADEQGTIAAVCRNVESGKPVGTLGHLHIVQDAGPVWSKSRQRVFKAAKLLAEDSTK